MLGQRKIKEFSANPKLAEPVGTFVDKFGK